MLDKSLMMRKARGGIFLLDVQTQATSRTLAITGSFDTGWLNEHSIHCLKRDTQSEGLIDKVGV